MSLSDIHNGHLFILSPSQAKLQVRESRRVGSPSTEHRAKHVETPEILMVGRETTKPAQFGEGGVVVVLWGTLITEYMHNPLLSVAESIDDTHLNLNGRGHGPVS